MSNTTEPHPELENLLEYLKLNRGFDFSGYKRTTLSRCITRRMQVVSIENYSYYRDYLEVHPDEFVELFNTILINVIAFVREPAAWEYIATEIIPQIISAKHVSKPIRVWSAGCASGEETYTIAILLAEALGMEQYSGRVKVFATDVDEEALNYARIACYSPQEVENIPTELLEKYFEQVNGRYMVQRELRRGVIFARHDLVQNAPISKTDLLICRNTLMYFNRETQSKIIERFHFAVNDTGFLFLGKAEMLFTRNNYFSPVDLTQRVFTKVPDANQREMSLNMTLPNNQPSIPSVVDSIRIYEAAFEIDSVAELVVDANSTIILANAKARNLCNLNPKDIGRSFQDLEISYRPVELRSCIDQAYTSRRIVTKEEVEWSTSLGETKYFDVQIIPLLNNTNQTFGVKITFVDVTDFKHQQNDLVHANQELETAYEELQSSNEELETTNEELQSTSEELETINEELQSTNEELETMNEELQSTNEEFQTMNEQLRLNSLELNRVNAFLQSILTSLRVGVVVISHELHILIWNRKAEDLWGVRADEVLSKHFMSLDINLPLEPFRQPLRAIVSGEIENHEVMLDAVNRRGRAIQCQVVSSPLLGSAGDIQGVIIIMEDREIEQES
jgi:two-component system CheB/CheR fusion protein